MNNAFEQWLKAVFVDHNLGNIAAITVVKDRPWSLVVQIESSTGIYFGKSCKAGGTFEPNLLLFLQVQSIQFIPEVIAVDLDHSWFLMADAGTPLRTSTYGQEKFEIWGDALAQYAQMQIASCQWVEQLLPFGLPDRRINQLPRLLDDLLCDDVIGTGRGVAELENLRRDAYQLMPKFEAVCALLESSPAAATLDHGDFHETNLLLGNGTFRLIDWGDSCITYPLCTFTVTWEALQRVLPSGEAAIWRDYLRDAYLGPWKSSYPDADISRFFDCAVWVGNVCRALDCAYMFTGADEETLNQWRPQIFDQLKIWVEAWDDRLYGDL